jgi:cell division protein FtsN
MMVMVVVMGVMVYSAKTEITKLTELTTALGKDKSGIVDTENQHSEINPKSELNHETDKTMEDSKHKPEAASPEMKPDHAAAKPIHEADDTTHNAKTVAPDSPAPSTSIEQAQIPSAPLKHEKSETVEASHKTENKPIEQQKENVEALAKKTSLSETLPTSADSKKTEIPAVLEKKQTSEHKPAEHPERKTEVIDKHKRPVTTSKKTAVKTKQKIVTPVSDWSVNLIAYKQQWYASSKAAEFAQKGVPVEILPVKINNVTWYRLRVGGFNNREEASLYAGRVKKALNLSSVWVGK